MYTVYATAGRDTFTKLAVVLFAVTFINNDPKNLDFVLGHPVVYKGHEPTESFKCRLWNVEPTISPPKFLMEVTQLIEPCFSVSDNNKYHKQSD